MSLTKLISTQTLVQAPYITVSMNGNILGTYTNNLKEKTDKFKAPNYIQQMQVTKINGTVNQYTITICYVVSPGADPNLIEKMLSTVKTDRIITISYGDCNQQNDSFKNEQALITKVSFQTNFKAPQITYTINAISAAVYTKGIIRNWPAKANTKPSTEILRILKSNAFGLKDIFGAMLNNQAIDRYKLIPTDDAEVNIAAKQSTSSFDYLKYLVSCMRTEGNADSYYVLSVFDTNDPPIYGSYFKITNIGKNPTTNITNGAYELDIGYPGDNFVSNFNIESNDQWSILYDYSTSKNTSQKSYFIDSTGEVVTQDSPMITRNATTYTTNADDLSWWKSMTDFPIKASVEIKGLVKPVNLVEYVHLNIIFFGRRSIYSGYYIITEQRDTISPQGYSTTIKLTRVKGDM